MLSEILYAIKIVTVFQLLFFSVFLFFHSRSGKLGNYILAGFLAALTFGTIYRLSFYDIEICIEKYPQLVFIGESSGLILGPSLYLYAQTIVRGEQAVNRTKLLLHSIPFIVFWAFFLPQLNVDFSTEGRLFSTSLEMFLPYADILIHGLIVTHFIVYTSSTLLTIHRYHKEMLNHYSTVEKLRFRWLAILITAFVSTWFLGFANYTSAWYGEQIKSVGVSYVFAAFIFSNLIIIKGLRQPQIFIDLFQIVPDRPKYSKTLLRDEEIKTYRQQVQNYMEKYKPYTDAGFTMDDLANALSLPAHVVSQVLNTSFEKNFFQFINHYRIEECKRLFQVQSGEKASVLEICYKSGFNSKTTFNTTFKKVTGYTPTEYLRKTTDSPKK